MAQTSERTARGEEIVDLLQDVNLALRDRLIRHGREVGLPRFSRRLPVMASVIRHPGITVNALARDLGMAKSQVSVLVSRLESEGVLRKEQDRLDQRLVRLYPTEEGRRLAERWRSAYRSVLARTVRGLSEDEAAHLLDGLRALRRALGEEEGRSGSPSRLRRSLTRGSGGR